MTPIIITAYNRTDCLKKTLDRLYECDGIENHPILAFVDGGGNVENVLNDYGVSFIKWQKNLGLKGNALAAISKAFLYHDRLIFLQDDQEVSRDFLTFMDWALNEFEEDEEIMFVSGYSHIPHKYSYTSNIISEGLGIWKSKFFIDNEFTNLKKFGEWSAPMFVQMLKNKNSFTALLEYSMFKRNGKCLHPNVNKIRHLLPSGSVNGTEKLRGKLNGDLYIGFAKWVDRCGLMDNELRRGLYHWSKFKRLKRKIIGALH